MPDPVLSGVPRLQSRTHQVVERGIDGADRGAIGSYWCLNSASAPSSRVAEMSLCFVIRRGNAGSRTPIDRGVGRRRGTAAGCPTERASLITSVA
jgi:hypothetical protein